MTTQPQTLPIPQNFPVQWESPEEAMRFWTVDLMHWPNGLSPLSATMDMPAFFRGLVQAAEELSMPIQDMRAKYVNGYIYMSTQPIAPAEMPERMQRMQVQMAKHIPGLLDRWYKEYEPEVRSINHETLHGDYSVLSNRELSALLEALTKKREREGLLHFLAVFPAMGAVMFFEEVYTNLFGPPQGGEHLQLLQGFRNKSVEAGDGLWKLSEEARRRPAVMHLLQTQPPAKVHAALPQVEGGAEFRGAVDEYTAAYGWRANELDVAEVTWREDPTPVYKLVKEYAARDDYDPEADARSLVAAREAREKLLLEKVSGGPVELFRQSLQGAQQYLPVQEDHNFWIDQQGVCVQRIPLLEAGRRLAAQGRIDDAADVFTLYYDELQDALRGGKGDLREVIANRRRDQERFQAMKPPDAIGTMPQEPAQDDNPMLTKFFGGPPEESPDPRIINGNGASAGKITGTARVILTLDEAERLRQGEILVAPATMPPWTPLFAIASGVVTDHGGVLSHTAIVAREYRIPAVIGTKVATSIIRDGQTITVDGAAGTVKLES